MSAAPPPASAQPKPKSTRKDKDDSANAELNIAQIGNYVLIKTLGEGNFAKVKLARHKLTNAEVAVKIIDKTQLDEKKLSKLYREVRVMKMLHHPNVVKLYEVIETKNTIFLVMEMATGGELYDYLVVHGRMKEKEARAKFRQILSAVSYCHKKRVIHRDLKAENLLLDSNLDIKVADFGFSNMFDPESKLDTFCGSPPYAAPELFQGRRYVGPEVDIWSLGVILYVLTTGCLPFDGKNLQEMRESVCRGKYRIPFYLSDSCEKLLRKFLVRDPTKRSSLDMLVDDAWINEGYSDSPIAKDVSTRVDEDEAIINLMVSKYHIDRDTILRSIRENLYDDVAAIYYLAYYEKQAKGEVPMSPIESGPPVPASSSKPRESGEPSKTPAGMHRIAEDEVLPALPSNGKPAAAAAATASASATAAARKRRFTVGNDKDVQNMADEENDPEAKEVLKKLQALQNPSKAAGADAGKKDGAGGGQLPTGVDVDAVVAAAVAKTMGGGNGSNDGSSSGMSGGRQHRNTIGGFFRNHIRRATESGAPSSAAPGPALADSNDETIMGSNDSSTEPSSGGAKPRSLRFTFNSNTTSSKPPDEIVQEVLTICDKLDVKHRMSSRYVVECTYNANAEEAVKFEVEVCKLPRLKNLHGLRFKRIGGDSNEYKEICEKILSEVKL